MNERQAGELEKQILDGKAAIVSSKHGGGKSTFIRGVFKKLGWDVEEYDVSSFTVDEWNELIELVEMRLGETIIYIPSIDRAKENRLLKIVKNNNKNAIVMETSKTWGLKDLRGYCRDIVLDTPDWRAMTEIMKQRGTYRGVTPQNLYHAYGDGGFERVESDWSLTAKFFKGESIEIDTKFLPWLIDNASNFLDGYELFRFLHYAAKIAATGKVSMIGGLAQRGKGDVERPYFHKKLGLVRNG
jgi:hypothetical protein